MFSAQQPISGVLGADSGEETASVFTSAAPKLLTQLTVWRRSDSDLVHRDAWAPRPAPPQGSSSSRWLLLASSH